MKARQHSALRYLTPVEFREETQIELLKHEHPSSHHTRKMNETTRHKKVGYYIYLTYQWYRFRASPTVLRLLQ